jgi:hypothetical protein
MMGIAPPVWQKGKRCFVYCGDDRCNCDRSPFYPRPASSEGEGERILRCVITGNPCGTDTARAGYECNCQGCWAWRTIASLAAQVERYREALEEISLRGTMASSATTVFRLGEIARAALAKDGEG